MRSLYSRAHTWAWWAAVATILISRSTLAADGAPPTDGPSPALDPSLDPKTFGGAVDQRMRRSWNEGNARLFLSTSVDVGFIYLRPRASVGYGKPHHLWFGIEGNPMVAGPAVGAYGGLRLAVPYFDIRVGARFLAALQHSFLPKRESYTRLNLESTALPRATTLALETEANANIPVGPGDVLLLASVSYLPNVPTNQNVFEEWLRVVVDPPWVLRGRAGYGLRFGSRGQFSVALVGDFVSIPERQKVVVRAGALFQLALSRSLEVRGVFVPRISSPDDVGLLDSDFTELGLRWRWATQ